MATKKEERLRRSAERKAKREALREKLDNYRAEAASITRSIPRNFSQWGALRSVAFKRITDIVAYRAELKTIKADELGRYVEMMKAIDHWPLELCRSAQDWTPRTKLFNSRAAMGTGIDSFLPEPKP